MSFVRPTYVYTRKETFLVAIFHSTAKVCSTSAKAKIDYISRQKKYSYSSKAEDLIYFEENNLPKWAKNARVFCGNGQTRGI